MQPLAIDLFCGLGGWTDGLLAEGYRVIGFDCEQHVYGEARYPAQLVIQNVLTLHGASFKDAALIVASPPCQAYSYRAMPWKRAKALPPPDNALFEACFRLQREAEAAAGHHIPLVVENVCGAQKWVGRARWHYGSFYLWGDVPALMPITRHRGRGPKAGTGNQLCAVRVDQVKNDPSDCICGHSPAWHDPPDWSCAADGCNCKGYRRYERATKNDGRKASAGGNGGWFGDYQAMKDGIKQHGSGREWFAGDGKISRMTSSKSSARKAASAHIAKIPLELARHIARAWFPVDGGGSGLSVAMSSTPDDLTGDDRGKGFHFD